MRELGKVKGGFEVIQSLRSLGIGGRREEAGDFEDGVEEDADEPVERVARGGGVCGAAGEGRDGGGVGLVVISDAFGCGEEFGGAGEGEVEEGEGGFV